MSERAKRVLMDSLEWVEHRVPTVEDGVVVTLTNESFVRAWQSSDHIEDFMEITRADEFDDAEEWKTRARRKAQKLRRNGVDLKYLDSINNDFWALNELAQSIG